MTETTSMSLARLRKLAEFRYQLRKFLSFSETATEAAGIPVQQYQLLQVVAAMPEGQEASIGYIAERMILRHNSAVELVDRAVRAGFVRRDSDQGDLRRSLVTLTPESGVLLDRLVTAHLAEIDSFGPKIVAAMEALTTSPELVGEAD
ncbi:MAG: MarR family transcriptional regulator [Acidobacteriota bacterium]|nr:MarR family transcriptional regulator [Acidobacteriota bacterium]